MDSSPNPKNYDFIDTLMLEQSSWQTEARVHRMSYRNGCGTQRVTIEIVSWPPQLWFIRCEAHLLTIHF